MTSLEGMSSVTKARDGCHPFKGKRTDVIPSKAKERMSSLKGMTSVSKAKKG